ncbi:hypothetical protein HK407_03g06060 [Ordospora pajunii]|jgi:hypothetical protein|uniref:uncharacterized protein n=1 Tax=Ordospora pajunii TaxID=3039483 RepID=UPI00295279AC|nr:uncharacterized protein HK407_03g06060 [Ordospora pajunii]KAH9411854.1 hypothetical protein HK407_03g06060 [Ordospora pajunii]
MKLGFGRFLKEDAKSINMLILSMILGVGAYYMQPSRHSLIITTRTIAPYRLDSFPFEQKGPYGMSMSPVLFAKPVTKQLELQRPFDAIAKINSEGESINNDKEAKGSIKHNSIKDMLMASTICKIFFYIVAAVLIFSIGYQTRKYNEGGTYVRLPTKSSN